uniref:Uncharacterized protein n=1 Tax=Amphimedon queenslandica TaxID=400682 RepID=A0A1X7TX40_AMPQE
MGIYIADAGFIASSPDGVVLNPEGMSVNDGCRNLKSFFCHLNGSNIVTLKRNHQYYYQIEGAMAITGAKWCNFVVWTPKKCTIQRITFNPYFWESTYSQLKDTYFCHILP